MKKIITYGTFDLLTPGHIEQLRESKKLGDYLIVGLSTDEFNQIKNKKAYLSYEERKVVLESIKYVDEVIPESNWDQKLDDIVDNDVSILTMGSDWEGSDKFNYLEEYCEVKFIHRSGKWASTHFRNFQKKHKNDNTLFFKFKVLCKKIFLKIFKFHLIVIYYFIKLFTFKKNRLFLLSRQFSEPSISFNYIKDNIDENIDVKIFCYRINKSFFSYLYYYFSMYKQMFYLATSKCVIIDGYNPVVSILKHKSDTTIIQLWHALAAIKKFGYQSLALDTGRDENVSQIMEMHRNYDYVISGSDFMNPIFAEAFDVDVNKVLSVGTPVIDYMLKPLDRKSLPKEYRDLSKKPTILYAPTFRDNCENNFSDLINAFDSEKYNIIVSIHPRATDKIVLQKGVICNPKIDFLDTIKLCDYFITDYSAAMLEALVADKKLLLYVHDYHLYEKETGINVNLFDEYKYVSKDINDIKNWIEKDKFDKKEISKFKSKFINNANGGSTKKICELVEGKIL